MPCWNARRRLRRRRRNVERGRPASNSLLEQAEIAFAAGRIIEPEFDNALNYYRSLLETEPDNKDAMQGVDRVVAYLENQAEGAMFQNDWDAARAYVAVILNVRADDPQAHDLRARANRLEHIQQLTAKALEAVCPRQPGQPEGRQRRRFVSRHPCARCQQLRCGARYAFDRAAPHRQRAVRVVCRRSGQSAEVCGCRARDRP